MGNVRIMIDKEGNTGNKMIIMHFQPPTPNNGKCKLLYKFLFNIFQKKTKLELQNKTKKYMALLN